MDKVLAFLGRVLFGLVTSFLVLYEGGPEWAALGFGIVTASIYWTRTT